MEHISMRTCEIKVMRSDELPDFASTIANIILKMQMDREVHRLNAKALHGFRNTLLTNTM